jgi:hypothetical protein
MDSHNSEQIDLAAYDIYKQTRRKHLRNNIPSIKESDIELKIIWEWENMTSKEKFPFIKIIEENPRLLDRTCQASEAHSNNACK